MVQRDNIGVSTLTWHVDGRAWHVEFFLYPFSVEIAQHNVSNFRS